MIPDTFEDICNYFDCHVIDDYDIWLNDIVYLGDEGDMTVGVYPFELTPLFASVYELITFCESEEGREYINNRAGELWYDWDTERQEWIEESL